MFLLAYLGRNLGYQELGQSIHQAAWSVVYIYVWLIPHLALIYLV